MKKFRSRNAFQLRTVVTWAILTILLVNLAGVALSSYIISQNAVFEQTRNSLEQKKVM